MLHSIQYAKRLIFETRKIGSLNKVDEERFHDNLKPLELMQQQEMKNLAILSCEAEHGIYQIAEHVFQIRFLWN